jgi:hypothetical protein
LTCFGGGDSYTNADSYEVDNGLFNFVVENDLPTGSSDFYYIKVGDMLLLICMLLYFVMHAVYIYIYIYIQFYLLSLFRSCVIEAKQK